MAPQNILSLYIYNCGSFASFKPPGNDV